MSGAGLVRRTATLAVATLLAVLGWSATAAGCPVCFAADERARASFLGTAVLLSALPFALFAGLALWLWRELARGEEGDADRGTPPSPGELARPRIEGQPESSAG